MAKNPEEKLRNYVKRKIDILRKQFLIKLTDDEIYDLRELKTEAEVDRYVRKIITNKL